MKPLYVFLIVLGGAVVYNLILWPMKEKWVKEEKENAIENERLIKEIFDSSIKLTFNTD